MHISSSTCVRRANRNELNWVNAKYADIGFVSSNYDNEVIAIAEVAREPAGIGRIVQIDQKSAELGGMYVLPNFRGQGVAKAIVSF